MRKAILFFILIFSLTSQAQKKPHIVELDIKKKLSISDFYISKVIDNRIIKSNIGYAQKGLTNKKVPALLPDSLENYLKQKLNLLLQKNDSSLPIVVVVDEFNVSEQTSAFSEKGRFRAQLQFAKEDNNKLYSLWYVEAEVESGGLDVTKKHDERIIKGLKKCIEEFSNSGWKDRKGELIEFESQTSFNYKKMPKSGLYSSFSQLSRNEPSIEKSYQIKMSKGKKYPKYKVFDENGKKLNKKVMFISDGKNIYINAYRYSYDSHFVKSKIIGKYVYFEDRISDSGATVAFGLLGAAISNKARGIVLDTQNGLVYLLTKKNTLKILEPYPELKKKYLKSKKKDKITESIIKEINNIHDLKL